MRNTQYGSMRIRTLPQPWIRRYPYLTGWGECTKSERIEGWRLNKIKFYSPFKWYGVPGEDYPRPMVKHEVVSKENIARHKKAYDAGLSYIFRTVLQYQYLDL